MMQANKASKTAIVIEMITDHYGFAFIALNKATSINYTHAILN